LCARVEEGDLEGAVGDPTVVTDQLVEPLLGDGPFALLVDVDPMATTRGAPSTRTRKRTGTPAVWAPSTRLTSRAWKRCAIRPPGSFRVVICGPTVQSPESAHPLSGSRFGCA
jgi:hypothetical protein